MKPEQITAWALNEASVEERQQLEAALLKNPQDKQKADETKAFCDFLLSELRDDALALTETQREKLKAQPVAAASQAPASGKAGPQTRWNIGIIVRLAAAACVALGGFWTWQAYSLKQPTPQLAVAEELGINVNLPQGVDAKKKQDTGAQTRLLASAPVKAVIVEQQPAGKPLPAATMHAPVDAPAALALSKQLRVMTPGDVEKLKQIQDQNAYALNFGDKQTDSMARASELPAADSRLVPQVTEFDGFINLGSSVVSPPKAVGQGGATLGGPIAGSGGIMVQGAGQVTLSGANTYTGFTTVNSGDVGTGRSVNSISVAPAVGGISPTLANADIPAFNPSLGYNFAHNMGQLGNNRSLPPLSGPSGGSRMNDGQEVTLGRNTYTGATQINAGTVNLSTAATTTRGDAFVTSAGVPAQMKRNTDATLTLAGGIVAATMPAAVAPPVILDKAAVAGASNTISISGSAPVALISDSAADTRYFSVDSISSTATKDMAQKQEATAFRRSDVTGESYTRIIENELKDVAREPLSTLSIDVDTASYANVRRFLNQNMIPPPDAVRIEELVNYFPTSEEGPAHEAKEPFGVRVELAPCPWQPVHRLARISIKGREMDKDRKASNLVFLVDVSGSMNEPAKLPLVQQSLRMLTEQLGEGDRVTIVVYAGSSGVVLPPTSGEKKEEILGAINRLSAGGSTHGSAGIKLAYEQAVAGFIKGGVNRVILCTDGDFNVGVSSPEELEKLIKHKAKTGVFLSVLGFGSGNLKDRTMETLADKGNGNYAYIDSLSEARKVLVEQMSGTLDTIAKDVKIQVEFNPAAVRSYRLIGYENRLLAKEDFNDDTKDAGEIGAGHSVVALYEIVPANLPPGAEPRPLVDSLKYQAPASSPAHLAEVAKSGEMMTVKLRYKEPESDLSKLIEVPTKDDGKTLTASSEDFKFSAAVAGFGLLLRDSSYKGTLSWETVRRLALDGKGADKLGYRGEFLQLIDKARGLKETRP